MRSDVIRVPLDEALGIFEPLSEVLTEARIPFEFAGSIRRREPEVKDIDLISGCPPARILEVIKASRLKGLRYLNQVGMSYAVRASISNFNVKIFCYKKEAERGSALLSWTGHFKFVRMLRGIAREQGYVLSPKGLLHNGLVVASRTEELIFWALGLNYIGPEDRAKGKTWKNLLGIGS
jgi:DNA polymerase (family 10)